MENLKFCNKKGKFSVELSIAHWDRCYNKRLGDTAREFPQEEMVKGGESFSYKCSRNTGINVCNPNFHKEFVTLDHSCSSGQQRWSGISLTERW